MLNNMELIKVIKSGVLPMWNKNFIGVHLANSTQFLDLDLNLLFELSNEFKIMGLTDDIAILRKEEIYYNFDLKKRKIQNEFKQKMKGGIIHEGKHLNLELRDKTIHVSDIKKNEIIWKHHFDTSLRVILFATNGKMIVGSLMDSSLKYCLDFSNGNIIWELNPTELNMNTKTSKLGRTYLVDNLVIGMNEHREYYALNSEDKKQVWNLQLPPKSMGQVMIENGKHYSISITNYKFGEDTKYDFFYIITDFLKGKIISKINISNEVYKYGLIPIKGIDLGGVFGQFSIDESSLYFGVDNRLIAMDKLTGKMEIIYEHDAKLMFSKIIHNKLFYTDDYFRTLVFDMQGQSSLS